MRLENESGEGDDYEEAPATTVSTPAHKAAPPAPAPAPSPVRAPAPAPAPASSPAKPVPVPAPKAPAVSTTNGAAATNGAGAPAVGASKPEITPGMSEAEKLAARAARFRE